MKFSHHHLFQPGTDPTAAPLLLLHGTGGTERDLLPLAQTLLPGSALLSPRGNVSEGGARRFFARLAEGVFDPTEVSARTLELAEFIKQAAQHYAFDAGRLTAIGFSNGANVAATLLQLSPKTLNAAILFRPMVVLDQPAAAGSLAGKRVLLANGAADPIVPADHPLRVARLLEAGGAEVTRVLIPASHGLVARDVAIATDWLSTSA